MAFDPVMFRRYDIVNSRNAKFGHQLETNSGRKYIHHIRSIFQQQAMQILQVPINETFHRMMTVFVTVPEL